GGFPEADRTIRGKNDVAAAVWSRLLGRIVQVVADRIRRTDSSYRLSVLQNLQQFLRSLSQQRGDESRALGRCGPAVDCDLNLAGAAMVDVDGAGRKLFRLAHRLGFNG